MRTLRQRIATSSNPPDWYPVQLKNDTWVIRVEEPYPELDLWDRYRVHHIDVPNMDTEYPHAARNMPNFPPATPSYSVTQFYAYINWADENKSDPLNLLTERYKNG